MGKSSATAETQAYDQLLTAAGQVIMAVATASFRILTVSSGASTIIGVTPEALINTSLLDWCSPTSQTELQMMAANLPVRQPYEGVLTLASDARRLQFTALCTTAEPGRLHLLLRPAPPLLETTANDAIFRVLARCLPKTAVFLLDAELRFLLAEGELLADQGMERTRIEGQLLTEVYEDNIALIDLYRLALTGESQRGEREYRGGLYSTVTIPIRNDAGDILGVLGTVQDTQVTPDSAQRNQEEWLRALLNAVPDMLMVQHKTGVFKDFHYSHSPMIQAAGQAMIGRDGYTNGLPPDVVEPYMALLRNVLETGESQTFEYQREFANERHYFEARIARLNSEHVLTLIRDISPFRRVQEELSQHIEDLTVLRQIESEISEGLNIQYVVEMALDAALRLSGANAGFIALYEEDNSLQVAHVIGEYDIANVNKLLRQQRGFRQRAVKEQTPYLISDIHKAKGYIKLLDDTRALMLLPLVSQERLIGLLNLESKQVGRFGEESFQMVRLIGGRIAAMLDNAYLYRQSRQQLAEMQRLYDEVSKLEKLKTDMIRIASHDLRNPLMALRGYLQLFTTEMEPIMEEKQKGYLKKVNASISQMQKISTGILSLERIEQMAQNRTSEIFDLVALVRTVFDEQQAPASDKAQMLALTLGAKPLYVLGDPVQLYEAVANLISNAIKYTPQGGMITVMLDKERDKGVCIVRDTGYGIPEAQQKRLFEPFFRAKSSETASIDGTGLGLHLVGNIIQRHSGRIIFSSVYGEGSTFGFELPLHATPPERRIPTGTTLVG
jgi:signal transduction histidine kinase/PAS domain-containing protein